MLCNSAYVTAHKITLQTSEGEGRRQAERAGVRMEARQGQDQRSAWAWFTTAVPDEGTPKTMACHQPA
ncbi:hypothetical protein F8N49_07635 [Pseudomonas sp. GXM4]|nr:hypothetical protein F8N49_07635 [Pseudomonas sp. GXM4]